MENTSIDLKTISKKFFSVDTTLSEPKEASNGKMYIQAKFEMNVKDDDGYSGQSRAYTKNFFEDSHSLQFLKAKKCLEDGTPLKIKAARIFIETPHPFYILDENGERQAKKSGGFRQASGVTLFLLEDENVQSNFNAACQRITDNDAWIMDTPTEDELDEEDIKVTTKGGKNGKTK